MLVLHRRAGLQGYSPCTSMSATKSWVPSWQRAPGPSRHHVFFLFFFFFTSSTGMLLSSMRTTPADQPWVGEPLLATITVLWPSHAETATNLVHTPFLRLYAVHLLWLSTGSVHEAWPEHRSWSH